MPVIRSHHTTTGKGAEFLARLHRCIHVLRKVLLCRSLICMEQSKVRTNVIRSASRAPSWGYSRQRVTKYSVNRGGPAGGVYCFSGLVFAYKIQVNGHAIR